MRHGSAIGKPGLFFGFDPDRRAFAGSITFTFENCNCTCITFGLNFKAIFTRFLHSERHIGSVNLVNFAVVETPDAHIQRALMQLHLNTVVADTGQCQARFRVQPQHSIAIAYQLPGIRFNSVGSVIGPGLFAAAVSVAAAGIAMVIGRLAAREGPELPIAAGLSGSVLASPYLSVTDLSALLIAAWLILRLNPPGWLKALMVVGYVPFFFANALFMHGPFLVLEFAWLLALLVFAIKLRRGARIRTGNRRVNSAMLYR